MSKNYTSPLAIDKDGTPMHSAPAPKLALQRFTNENNTASSVLTASQDATKIEIGTSGTMAVMRWVATSDTEASVIGIAGTTSNYDHMIPANSLRTFVIPIESFQPTGYGSQMGANRANGLYRRYAVKSQGIGSVVATEYP